MAKEQPARGRSQLAICREWLCWALLTIAIVGFWIFLGRTVYLWLKDFF
jgi:hypothetical protein